MNNQLKNFIISFYLRYSKKEKTNFQFSKDIKNANEFFLILPENKKELIASLSILNYLRSQNKRLYLFLSTSVSSSIPYDNFYYKVYYEIDKTKLDFPKKHIKDELSKIKVDLLIDLNIQDNLFTMLCTNFVNAKNKIGFSKKFADKIYNIQFKINQTNSEISYENLLNFIKQI